MPILPPPPFKHDNQDVDDFITGILQSTNIPNRAQIILMCGVALENKDLMAYACNIDTTVVNRIVPTHVLQLIDDALEPATGIKLAGACQ